MSNISIYTDDQPLPEQLEYYKEENRKLQGYVSAFEHECRNACDDIFKCACRRAIARMNKEVTPESVRNGGAIGNGFTPFEVLSVSVCHLGYDYEEINPYLPDYISDILEDECDNFSTFDLLALKYGEGISSDSQCGYCDFQGELLKRLKDTFYGLLEDTYNSDKVQQFCENM